MTPADELFRHIYAKHQADLRVDVSLSIKTEEHLCIQFSPNGELKQYNRGHVRAWLYSAPPDRTYCSSLFFQVLLHELMERDLVLFSRSTVMLGIACAKAGRQAIKRLFEDAVWIPCFATEAALVSELRSRTKKLKPEVVFFQNEGVCLAADTREKMKELVDTLFRKAQSLGLREPELSGIDFDSERAARIAPAIRMLLRSDHPGSIAVFHTNRELQRHLHNKACFRRIARPLVHEQVVLCNAYPVFVPHRADPDAQNEEIRKRIGRHKKKHGLAPSLVAVEKLGIFAWGRSKGSADDCWNVFLNSLRILSHAESSGGGRPIPKPLARKALKEKRFVESAGIERGEGNQRFLEKIAVVTGAAQGIGEGLARKLAGEGAYVVLADINEDKAKEHARDICRTLGANKASGYAVDVGSEPSIKKMIIAVALEYGGIDIFVNNAGIVRAGSIEELGRDVFDLVTKINYTAFFLCCKYASWIMKIQNRFDRNHFADIILINSKTGLIGSRKNFAYAGSKFGGIGLVQSFALELARSNIKVNAICPGNYLEGPLWSDPGNGLLVQYLRTKKVAGAKSVEDVRNYYANEAPMKRSCQIEDIFRAVAYVIEQEYETGQAVPVTGGQLMLS
jgi:NAD(P)-dependent dehydrogenase (short-subunit alcohol dehydrogenase family)